MERSEQRQFWSLFVVHYSSRFVLLLICVILTIILPASIIYSNTPPTPYPDPQRVPRVDGHIKVDGVLDDDIWKAALVLGLGFEVRPEENVPPPVKTEALLAYSTTHLFVAIRAYDPDPSQIRARINDRDNIWDDDWAGVLFDTFNDERRSIDFLCNPLGVQCDFIEGLDSGGSLDVIWDSDGRITDEGYFIEMAIPFNSLRFQRTEGDQVWGFDAVRSYPRSVRHHIGVFPRDRNNNNYWSQTVKLIGFAGVDPGHNIEIDPTISGIVSHERENETSGPMKESLRDLEAGVTGRWGITPNLTLNATINPDFAQVEADAAQLEVNKQYSLYYDEQRPFFLEGSDFFDTRINAVHTRTMADPNWGTKLTGKEGGNTIGFILVEDDQTNLIFPSSEGSDEESLEHKSTSTILRYKRDLGESSAVGLLLTDREGDNYYNRVAGVDAIFRFFKTDRLNIQLLGSQTQYPDEIISDYEQPEDEFQGSAIDLFYLHGTNSLDYYAGFRQIDENLRSDLGFIPQTDIRHSEAGFGYTWYNDNDHWWNMLNFGSGIVYESTIDDKMLNRYYECWANYNGPLETSIDFYGRIGQESFNNQEFNINYAEIDCEANLTSDVFFEIEGYLGRGIDYDNPRDDNTRSGNYFGFSPFVNYKIGRHIDFNFGHDYEQMRLNEGLLYTANISQLRVKYNFTKKAYLRAILQYIDYDYNTNLYDDAEQDSRDQRIRSQLLFTYMINPQTVLYLGYSDKHQGYQNIDIIQSDRTFFVKLGYAFVK